MKTTTASLLALLALTSTSCANEFSSDTVVRMITIDPPNLIPGGKRVFISSDTGTLEECKEAIDASFEDLKPEEDGLISMCVPVDLTELPSGIPTFYMRQFTHKENPFSSDP